MFSCNVLPVGSLTRDIPDLGAYLQIQDPVSATAGEKGVRAAAPGPGSPLPFALSLGDRLWPR